MAFTAPAPNATSIADAERLIHERYPDLENVFRSIPEIWNILIWSVSGANLSRTQIDAAMQKTNWWRTRNEKQRAWHVLVATDPAQAVRLQKQMQNDVLLASRRLGANFNLGQIGYVSQLALENGWTASELNDQIVGYVYRLPGKRRGTGEFGATITKVREIANEYGLSVQSIEAANLAKELLWQGSQGNTPSGNEASLRDLFNQRAKSLYPSLRRELEAGVTVAQWAEPFKQLAAQELGINPDSITFNDPKWKAMLEGTKTKDGWEPLSLAQWQETVRSDPRYGYDQSIGGQQIAAGLAQGLAEMFGGAA